MLQQLPALDQFLDILRKTKASTQCISQHPLLNEIRLKTQEQSNNLQQHNRSQSITQRSLIKVVQQKDIAIQTNFEIQQESLPQKVKPPTWKRKIKLNLDLIQEQEDIQEDMSLLFICQARNEQNYSQLQQLMHIEEISHFIQFLSVQLKKGLSQEQQINLNSLNEELLNNFLTLIEHYQDVLALIADSFLPVRKLEHTINPIINDKFPRIIISNPEVQLMQQYEKLNYDQELSYQQFPRPQSDLQNRPVQFDLVEEKSSLINNQFEQDPFATNALILSEISNVGNYFSKYQSQNQCYQ